MTRNAPESGGGVLSATLAEQAVTALANQAIAEIAASSETLKAKKRAAQVRRLCKALVHPNEQQRHNVVAQLMASGISIKELIEIYVPTAARKLGESWMDDTLTFAQVTIGSARLQDLVKSFAESYAAAGNEVTSERGVLLIVPDFEDHCLGGFVAAEQMRRAGCWVHLKLQLSRDEVVQFADANAFALIGLSISAGKPIERIEALVSGLRQRSHGTIPIVIGGSIVDSEQNLKQKTGADLVSSNPHDVLRFLDRADDLSQKTNLGLGAPAQAIDDSYGAVRK